MKVCLVYRDTVNGGTSIEEIFWGLEKRMEGKVAISRFSYQKHIPITQTIRLLRRQNADVFHITGGIYQLAYFLRNRRIILTVHDIGRYKKLRGWKKIVYREVLLRGPMRLAETITTVSAYTKNDIEQLFGNSIAQKIKVIYNPVPLQFSRNDKPFNSDKPRILQVGTGDNKNIETAIKAVSGTQAELIIIGRLTQKHLELLKQNKITYENYFSLSYEEVYDQYCQSDVVIFISLHEGFGMPVLEAQVTGRPVIASRRTSIPEIGGEGVHYIQDPLDVEEVKAGLVKIISNKYYRSELVLKGFENAKRFDPDLITREYIDLYMKDKV